MSRRLNSHPFVDDMAFDYNDLERGVEEGEGTLHITIGEILCNLFVSLKILSIMGI